MALKSLNSNAIRGEFYRTIEETPLSPAITSLAYLNTTSDQFTETYAFLGDISSYEEWVGSYSVKQLKDYKITIPNKQFRVALGVSVDEVENDKLGLVQGKIDSLSGASSIHWNNMLSDLIASGTSKVCYDGDFFFGTAHPTDNTTQSNKINYSIGTDGSGIPTDQLGSTTNPSPASMARAILKAITQLLSLKSDTGRPVNQSASSFVLVVPLPLLAVANQAVSSAFYGVGQSNPIATSSFNITVQPDLNLTWTNQFALFRTDASGIAKPFILQEMNKPKYTKLDENSDTYHKEFRMEFASTTRRGAGYGLYHLAVHTTFVS
jgi:phage major head subunit gpT-like protein